MKKRATSELKKIAQHRRARSEGLLDWLFNWLDTSLVQQTAGELARECREEIWVQVGDQLHGMTPVKAREYVRSVALDVIDGEVELVMHRRAVRATLRNQIVADAAEQLLDLIARDVARVSSHRRASRSRAA